MVRNSIYSSRDWMSITLLSSFEHWLIHQVIGFNQKKIIDNNFYWFHSHFPCSTHFFISTLMICLIRFSQRTEHRTLFYAWYFAIISSYRIYYLCMCNGCIMRAQINWIYLFLMNIYYGMRQLFSTILCINAIRKLWNTNNLLILSFALRWVKELMKRLFLVLHIVDIRELDQAWEKWQSRENHYEQVR